MSQKYRNFLTKISNIKIFGYFSKKIYYFFFLNKNTANRLLNSKIIINDNNSNLPSIYFWTTHKCASTFITNFCSNVSKKTKYMFFDYDNTIARLGNKINISDPFKLRLNKKLYGNPGEFYGPLRSPLPIKFKNAVHIFFLRDPRDVLVSSYFSFAYSHSNFLHSKLNIKFEKKRREIIKMGINKYCIEECSRWIIPLYEKYIQIIKTNEKVYIFKYDIFIKDPNKFIRSLLKLLNIENYSDDFLNSLMPFPIFDTKNKYNHLRSGLSKQYKTELHPNTIKFLNLKLKKINEFFKFK